MDTTLHNHKIPFNVEGFFFIVNSESDLAMCRTRFHFLHRNLTLLAGEKARAPTVTPQCPLLQPDESAIYLRGDAAPPSSHFSQWITLTPWRGDYTSCDVRHHWHAPATVEWVSEEWGDVRYRSRIPSCPVSVMCFWRVHSFGRSFQKPGISFVTHFPCLSSKSEVF